MTSTSLRVLMVSNDPSMFNEGSEVRARLREYATHFEELHVLSRGYTGVISDGNLFLHGAGMSRIWSKFFLAKKARAIAKEHAIQVVSAQDPFEHGRVAAIAAEEVGAKLHLQIHTDFLAPAFRKESFRNRVRVRMADAVLPNADGIRVVSERIKKSLLARYGEAIVVPAVLPIAVPADDVPAVPLPSDMPQFRLVAVSRLEKEKRLEDVLLAVSRVHNRYPSIGVAIVGDGSKRKSLVAYARKLGIQKSVWFLGWRTTDVRSLIKSATAFIQASSYEGYGRTLVEAALAHVPIITTDVGIIGDVLMPETDALVCPVGDVVCLENHINRLVADNALRTTLAMNAKRAVESHRERVSTAFADVAADIASVFSNEL